MPIITTLQGRQFTLDGQESLLSAASRQQVNLPYSCKTGRCKTCRGKVVSGNSRALKDEIGLTLEERDAGWILSCVRTADSDLLLDVEDLGTVEVPMSRTLPCRIDQLERLASDVVKVTLRLPPTANWRHLAGQYIDVIGPNGVRRSYSLANDAGQLLELHIREVPDGIMSAYWFAQAKANDLLRLQGPQGTFFLRDVAGKDLVFLATGTGIAPVRAMLQQLVGAASENRDEPPRSVTVYWGGRHPEDLYLDDLPLPPGAILVKVLSRVHQDWQGRRGYVQQALLDDRRNFSDCVVYACGSDAMIQDARAALLAQGLPEKSFFADAFVCSA